MLDIQTIQKDNSTFDFSSRNGVVIDLDQFGQFIHQPEISRQIPGIQTLSFSGNNLGSQVSDLLRVVFNVFPNIQIISLRNCKLTNEAFIQIANALVANMKANTRCYLDLAFNTSIDAGLEDFANILATRSDINVVIEIPSSLEHQRNVVVCPNNLTIKEQTRLTSNWSRAMNAITNLEHKMSQNEGNSAQLVRRNVELANRMTSLDAHISRLESRISSDATNIRNLQRGMDNLVNILTQNTERTAQLARQQAELTNGMTSLESNVTRYAETTAQLEAKQKELINKAEQQEEASNALKNNLESLEAELSKVAEGLMTTNTSTLASGAESDVRLNAELHAEDASLINVASHTAPEQPSPATSTSSVTEGANTPPKVSNRSENNTTTLTSPGTPAMFSPVRAQHFSGVNSPINEDEAVKTAIQDAKSAQRAGHFARALDCYLTAYRFAKPGRNNMFGLPKQDNILGDMKTVFNKCFQAIKSDANNSVIKCLHALDKLYRSRVVDADAETKNKFMIDFALTKDKLELLFEKINEVLERKYNKTFVREVTLNYYQIFKSLLAHTVIENTSDLDEDDITYQFENSPEFKPLVERMKKVILDRSRDAQAESDTVESFEQSTLPTLAEFITPIPGIPVLGEIYIPNLKSQLTSQPVAHNAENATFAEQFSAEFAGVASRLRKVTKEDEDRRRESTPLRQPTNSIEQGASPARELTLAELLKKSIPNHREHMNLDVDDNKQNDGDWSDDENDQKVYHHPAYYIRN